MDPNWTRWIHSSIYQYLKTVANGANIASLVEGVETRTKAFSEANDKIEIRVNGPYFYKYPSDHYVAKININVLVTSLPGGDAKNAYAMLDALGIMAEAMDQPIPVFDYSLPDGDPARHLGCLAKERDKLGLRVINFGAPDPNDPVRQGMVSGAYNIELRG